MIRAMVCCNLLETGARHFWLLEIDNGKPAGLFDSLQGLMPITVEATRKLRITGFLLAKAQSSCPVLKSRELELVAGKLVRKERRSVSIAVSSRTAWLRATHQRPPRSAAKVKKTAVKRSPTEQKQLGKFFGSSKGRARTKPDAKVHTVIVKEDPVICNRSSREPAENGLESGVDTHVPTRACIRSSSNGTGPRTEAGAQSGLYTDQCCQLHVEPVVSAGFVRRQSQECRTRSYQSRLWSHFLV